MWSRLEVPVTARTSFYNYNDESDLDALVAGLHKARSIFSLAGSNNSAALQAM